MGEQENISDNTDNNSKIKEVANKGGVANNDGIFLMKF